MIDHSMWQIILWMAIGFFGGMPPMLALIYLETYRIARAIPAANRIESWLRKTLLHDLDTKTARYMETKLVSIARRQPKQVSGRLVGLCACGCGQKVYYSGRGRKPIFVNSFHKELYQGKRVALPTP